MKKVYYHVIEDGGYGRIGSHGYYTTLTEAEAEVKRLSGYFPNCYFYVYTSSSKREPEFITV